MWVRRFSLSVVLLLLIAQWVPVGLLPALYAAAGDPVNLALGKSITASSGISSAPASKVVDGDMTTFWQPLSSDRTDLNLWLTVNLGQKLTFNKLEFHLNRSDNMKSYRILYSDDNLTWSTAYTKSAGVTKDELPSFPGVTAQYVKLDLTLSTSGSNVNMYELSVYNTDGGPVPADLTRIYFVDDLGKEYPDNGAVQVNKGTTKPLALKGVLSTGEVVDIADTPKVFKSSTTDITISASGVVTAAQVGASSVQAIVNVNGADITTNDLWVIVEDPGEFLAEEYVVNTQVTHPSMTVKTGQPAVILPGDVYPTISVVSNVYGTISGEVIMNGSASIAQIPAAPLARGETVVLTPQGGVPQTGQYEIRFKIEQTGKPPVFDSYYFTSLMPDSVPQGQSSIAFLGMDGKMVYVGDYRGNKILDFSNTGYMGGGVKIPEVQARIAVEPGEGDDTALIQAAIDAAAKMPLDANGFRGAVLLKKGLYEVGGTLNILAGGIVLRGEGQGSDGTIIYGTGTNPRNLVVAGTSTGPAIDTSTRQDISDLYVPSSARSFHVNDAGSYRVGDSVIVRRVGNDRWIHEVDMDQIYNRPGSGVTQWSAFNLDYDRVITAINGNSITVDAPLANAIDRKWGGGQLYKYNDDARIQQVGIENMRVDSYFDPTVLSSTDDNGKTPAPYYADENHAEKFVLFNSVKNGWVRDVTGYHLSYSLVQMSGNSKWITVQDSKMYDMVSIITGGRRYIIYQQGQLNFVQRIYTETARHAFLVDSRVEGPNVFLDSEAVNNFNTSEPHHRWSTGGLYDNIKAPIAMIDRAWLGSGHGWAGANYVTWNTEGALTAQSPPTAQNYAIGHVGTVGKPLVPSSYDPRQRDSAYWDHLGEHVGPVSIYKQQISERLGAQSLENIKYYPVGGGELDIPKNDLNQRPLLKEIRANGELLTDFSPTAFDYTIDLPLGTTQIPAVTASGRQGDQVTISQAASVNGTAAIKVYDKNDPQNSIQYKIKFRALPVDGQIPSHLIVYPIIDAQASSFSSSNTPARAVDKDLNTRWSASGEQWIQFDLGQEKTVSYILLARYLDFKYKYDIQASTDGLQWTTIYSGQSSGLAQALETVPLTSEVKARFIRINGHGNDRDSSNNVNEIVIAGDIPSISLLGNKDMTLEVFTPFQDPGATAVDAKDGDLSTRIIVTGQVDITHPGANSLAYDVVDNDGHPAATVTRTVYVRDTTAPVIHLIGDNPLPVEKGDTFRDPFATAQDNYDGDLTSRIQVTGTVDMNTAGTYTLRYHVTDNSGNQAVDVTRIVQVVDQPPQPFITLAGDNPMKIEVLTPFQDPGATAVDAKEGDLSSRIIVTGQVNISRLGTYTLTYNVIDSDGHQADTVYRSVYVADTTAPVVQLFGSSSMKLLQGEPFTDPKAFATDNYDGDLTARITVTGSVYTGTLGTYILRYNVVDSSGNQAAEVIRTVQILEKSAKPVIQLLGSSPTTIGVFTPYQDSGATAKDLQDGDITSRITVTGSVYSSKVGTYTLSYNVMDSDGINADPVFRTVIVRDTTKPVIHLLGKNIMIVLQGDTFTDPKATADDNYDGNLTNLIKVIGTVDTKRTGTYILRYNVSDSSGNKAAEVTRLVQVIPRSWWPFPVPPGGINLPPINGQDVFKEIK